MVTVKRPANAKPARENVGARAGPVALNKLSR